MAAFGAAMGDCTFIFSLPPPPRARAPGIDDGYDPMNRLIQHFLKKNMFITTEKRASGKLQKRSLRRKTVS